MAKKESNEVDERTTCKRCPSCVPMHADPTPESTKSGPRENVWETKKGKEK